MESMTKVKVLIGIDISKSTFDVCIQADNKFKSNVYSNDSKGFEQFANTLPADSHCVMEATGPYYLPLACWLSSHQIGVSVINPLVIKRYCQMKLSRAKTDKADARQLAEYGMVNQLATWTPPQDYVLYLKQYWAYEQQLKSYQVALGNLLESMTASGRPCKPLQQRINRDITRLKKQIVSILAEMETIANEHYGTTLDNVSSIPGIGRKTAMLLLMLTDGFKRFENAKQVVAYFGLSPRIFESGSSIKGKGRICKMGMSRIRASLYVCSWAAKRYNSFCKDLYDRLVAKGKAKSAALVAVMGKLVRQAFAVAKSDLPFQSNYSKNICF
jgi:transposase